MSVRDRARNPSRRKVLTNSAAAAGATAALVAFPQVSRAQTTTLKMQSSWSAKSIFQEMAKQYTKRVEDMSGGRLKIDLLPEGAVVKASRRTSYSPCDERDVKWFDICLSLTVEQS